MKSCDELEREIEVLGDRIATLSAAVLRLGSSLDLATVLQEAFAPAPPRCSARRAGEAPLGETSLTNARSPAISASSSSPSSPPPSRQSLRKPSKTVREPVAASAMSPASVASPTRTRSSRAAAIWLVTARCQISA